MTTRKITNEDLARRLNTADAAIHWAREALRQNDPDAARGFAISACIELKPIMDEVRP